MEHIEKLLVQPTQIIREALIQIDEGAKGIVLVVDDKQKLLDTISDGDVRRAMLSGIRLNDTVASLLEFKRSRHGYTPPATATSETSSDEMVAIMRGRAVRQLPIVDEEGRVIDIEMLDSFVDNKDLPVKAVIMAGGIGSRLRPLTDNTPKPMLSIGGRPLMERMVLQLRESGIRNINVTTHYLPEKIRDHFGSGESLGVNMNYVSEDQPLGTAGSLGLVGGTDETLLVMNGDILTRVDFRDMLKFHRERQAALTVAVRQYDVKVPYGVVDAVDGNVHSLREKPELDFLVNAGIYLLEPSVLSIIPRNERFDMTDVISELIQQKQTVVSFPIVEYWLDIGQHDDFRQAQKDVQQMRWAS